MSECTIEEEGSKEGRKEGRKESGPLFQRFDAIKRHTVHALSSTHQSINLRVQKE